MKTIKPYYGVSPMSSSSGPKGSSTNPYTEEEFDQMVEAGTWQGGYVEGKGYCMKEVTVTASSYPDSSSSGSDDSWPWPSEDSEDKDDHNPPTPPTPPTGGDGGGTGGGGSSSGGGNTGGGGTSPGGNTGTETVGNAGESDESPQYTLEEAMSLMKQNKWPGGYIKEIILPGVTVTAHRYTPLPSNGKDILDRAKIFEGVPYVMGGCNKNGMDCSGLVTAALGIPRWTTSSGPIPGMQKVNLTNKNENFVSELQTGDILVWKGVHTAIYDAEKGKIFHAHGSKGTPVGYTSDLITHWFKEHKLPTVYRK